MSCSINRDQAQKHSEAACMAGSSQATARLENRTETSTVRCTGGAKQHLLWQSSVVALAMHMFYAETGTAMSCRGQIGGTISMAGLLLA